MRHYLLPGCSFIQAPSHTVSTCRTLTNISPVWRQIKPSLPVKPCNSVSTDTDFNDRSPSLSTHTLLLTQVRVGRVWRKKALSCQISRWGGGHDSDEHHENLMPHSSAMLYNGQRRVELAYEWFSLAAYVTDFGKSLYVYLSPQWFPQMSARCTRMADDWALRSLVCVCHADWHRMKPTVKKLLAARK